MCSALSARLSKEPPFFFNSPTSSRDSFPASRTVCSSSFSALWKTTSCIFCASRPSFSAAEAKVLLSVSASSCAAWPNVLRALAASVAAASASSAARLMAFTFFSVAARSCSRTSSKAFSISLRRWFFKRWSSWAFSSISLANLLGECSTVFSSALRSSSSASSAGVGTAAANNCGGEGRCLPSPLAFSAGAFEVEPSASSFNLSASSVKASICLASAAALFCSASSLAFTLASSLGILAAAFSDLAASVAFSLASFLAIVAAAFSALAASSSSP
mmetsp:Transcript_79596/g.257910  ORF Transcript_79596/g.257910 Transcript_79596/m.257910 type:complete len:275 (+) Transcript_79596:589-1413(+)